MHVSWGWSCDRVRIREYDPPDHYVQGRTSATSACTTFLRAGAPVDLQAVCIAERSKGIALIRWHVLLLIILSYELAIHCAKFVAPAMYAFTPHSCNIFTLATSLRKAAMSLQACFCPLRCTALASAAFGSLSLT